MNSPPHHQDFEESKEEFETLYKERSFRVERIFSHGHASPAGFWYDQDEAEWVLLLGGEAKLRFEGEDSPIPLRPGEFLTIAAHRRHRVEWTTPDEATVWLAVHFDGD